MGEEKCEDRRWKSVGPDIELWVLRVFAKEGENCEALIEDMIRIMDGQKQGQEKILTDSRRKKEDEARDKRGRGKNGVVKRILRRFLA